MSFREIAQFDADCDSTGEIFVKRRSSAVCGAGEHVCVIFIEELCGVRSLTIFLDVGHDGRIAENVDLDVLFLDGVGIYAIFVRCEIALHVFDELLF